MQRRQWCELREKEESMNVRFIGSVLALIWCFHASLKSTESVVLHVFDHLLGVAAVRHAFAREKQTERKKRNILLRSKYVLVKQNKKGKEVQSHVFEVVTFRSRLVCWRCLELHMSMRRLSSNSGCSVHVRYFNYGRRFPHSSSPRVSLSRLSKQ